MGKNVIQIKSGITINIDMSVKHHSICEKYYFWNPAICSYKSDKHLASIIDSVITCNKVIKETKTISTNFNEKS